MTGCMSPRQRQLPVGGPRRDAVGHHAFLKGPEIEAAALRGRVVASQLRRDGNTLVIETTNFNGRTWLDSSGHFASDALRVVERLTLVDGTTIHYAATVEDPNVFARPWTIVFAMERMEAGYEQMEEACHESDHDGEHLLQNGYKRYSGPRFPAPPR
jgi:hypothetical protein